MFERKELQDIEFKAEELANTKGTNPSWVRAYQRLADSANNLDAMIARTIEK